MFGAIILALSVIVSVATGFFVYARNPKNPTNRVYGLLTLSLVVLSITNYLSLATTDRLFYIRSVIACSTVVVASLYYLILLLGGRVISLSRIERLGIIFTAFVFSLDFSPLVFSGLQGKANPVPVPNFGAAIFFVHLLVFLVGSAMLLVSRLRRTRGLNRLQYVYMLVGVSPIIVFAPVTGFVIPILLKDPEFISLTPLYGAFFVCLVGYSMVRHRLFDIQFFVVRATAYLSTLFLMTFLFITPFVLLLSHFLKTSLSPRQIVTVVLLSVGLLYLLQILRRYFDGLTNRVFFRNFYDPQDVLDRLSGMLVRTVDLPSLSKETANILEVAVKPQMLKYVLLNDADSSSREVAHRLDLITAHLNGAVDVDDPSSNLKPDAMAWLRKNNIAMAIRLHTRQEDLGFMVLGHKQSGELYNDRDKRLLAVAADEIAISLQNVLRFDQIQRFNITLQEEVDAATHKLQRQNKRLEELDNIKDDFISMASHQLRTPLTSVKGYLSMVLEGDAGKLTRDQNQMLKQAFASSQRMVFLITDLLNVSRLKTGKFVIDALPTNLDEVVKQELAQLHDTAEAKKIELSYKPQKDFPELMLDEVKIRQVIMNFVDNAIYYTPIGGRIKVELIDKPATVELRVTDNGIGVPRSEQHHLFTKFYRATNARTARPDGTGLGLFMAQKVILAQGGSVIFQSKEGQGSTFGFSFSKSKLAVKGSPPAPQPESLRPARETAKVS